MHAPRVTNYTQDAAAAEAVLKYDTVDGMQEGKQGGKAGQQQTHMAGGREGKMEGFVKTSPQATVDKIEREREREKGKTGVVVVTRKWLVPFCANE
jgi:hypothetical protein